MLATYQLVTTELLFGLGVYRPKKGEGGDIALEVTSYQLPVTSNQLLLLLLLLLIINNSAKRIQNWG